MIISISEASKLIGEFRLKTCFNKWRLTNTNLNILIHYEILIK
jgi:hypothetical protein